MTFDWIVITAWFWAGLLAITTVGKFASFVSQTRKNKEKPVNSDHSVLKDTIIELSLTLPMVGRVLGWW